MWEYMLMIGLVTAAGCWILYPLFKPDDYKVTPVSRAEEILRRLETEKENAYGAIHELEFDYHMGKLSAEDFESLNRRYRQDAAGLLEAIDRFHYGESHEKATEV